MASKPGGRGGRKKFTSKGGNRHFTDYEELKKQNEEIKREKAMQRAQEDVEGDSDDEQPKVEQKAKVVDFDKQLTKTKKAGKKEARDDSGSASSSEGGGESSSDADDEEDDQRAKGVQHLIEVENPNRKVQKMKKMKDLKLDDSGPSNNAPVAAGADEEKPQLSRKEKEALEAERKKQEYLRLHALGKTDEARADLARLAIIKKQREEAAKKRDEEKKAKEQAEAKLAKEKLAGKH